ncbi:MAG: hypothetical protein ACI9A1_001686 [Lentimonas sp.]
MFLYLIGLQADHSIVNSPWNIIRGTVIVGALHSASIVTCEARACARDVESAMAAGEFAVRARTAPTQAQKSPRSLAGFC